MVTDSQNPTTAARLAARFIGADGRRLLCDALLKQPLVQGKEDAAELLSGLAVIQSYEGGATIIPQGGMDTDIFFVLVGSIIVSPNGRDDTIRLAGTHVGEMTTIDPSARRSVTVRANETTVLARISEPDFSNVARVHPSIWRYLAREMADRLRQRVAKVPARKQNPRVFIASSSEGLHAAAALQMSLNDGTLEAALWTDGIFVPGMTNIEALEAELVRADFAVLLLSPDDQVVSRNIANDAPRDNLILELGLFAGALGRRRAIMVRPQGTNMKLPTDLLGVIALTYSSGDDMSTVAAELRAVIASLGPR